MSTGRAMTEKEELQMQVPSLCSSFFFRILTERVMTGSLLGIAERSSARLARITMDTSHPV